ncbi:cytochrome P450 [Neolentinus lepideus HHB14362 ss-1]|uniref:Cytochrome P450 n=1 Tax=Neolentinus lepideus HHB14362 ss-1 TaxID=1314782 RepID=A0A165QL40_9AGAM|nr:cytochrome P450 [Neolentinus lepideus HHB14362 ss-1]
MAFSSSLLFQFVFLSAVALLFKRYRDRRAANPQGLPYPPGPKSIPIFGNYFQVPKVAPWETYEQWGKQYGEIVHMENLGEHTIIINSAKVANDLLEKRSNKYSDRPPLLMLNMMGWDFDLGFIGYGPRWREHRRLFHQEFRQDRAQYYRPTTMLKAHELARRTLEKPNEFLNHIRHFAGANILAIVYDYQVADSGDYYVGLVEKATAMMAESQLPGASAVDYFPILKYLPGTKSYAKEGLRLTTEMCDYPFNYVKSRMSAGVGSECMASKLLERLQASGSVKPEDEDTIRCVAGAAYAAGADPIVAALGVFFVAMVLHPEAQKKAQEEIDRVIGDDRLPTFDDRASLPYVEALYREVLRWRPALPLSISHATTEEDVYEGYFIPKGTTVLMNLWAIHRDERTYPEATKFKPERYQNPDGTVKDEYPVSSFGGGRRICPGRHFADTGMWAVIALTLAAFNISKSKDEMPGRYGDGMISHALPFKYHMSVRSETYARLIQETAAEKN